MQKLNTREDFEIDKFSYTDASPFVPVARFADGRTYCFDGLETTTIRFRSFNYIDENGYKVLRGGVCDKFCDDYQIYTFQFAYLETALRTSLRE